MPSIVVRGVGFAAAGGAYGLIAPLLSFVTFQWWVIGLLPAPWMQILDASGIYRYRQTFGHEETIILFSIVLGWWGSMGLLLGLARFHRLRWAFPIAMGSHHIGAVVQVATWYGAAPERPTSAPLPAVWLLLMIGGVVIYLVPQIIAWMIWRRSVRGIGAAARSASD